MPYHRANPERWFQPAPIEYHMWGRLPSCEARTFRPGEGQLFGKHWFNIKHQHQHQHQHKGVSHMHMKHHPFVRTSQDLRRSIARLESFIHSPLNIPAHELEIAKELLNDLKELHRKVPDEYRDADLQKG